MAALADARDRGRPGRHPDHVRRRRRAAADRVRAAVAGRLRGLATGADRQRRERAAPARRLRRGPRRALPGARQRGVPARPAGVADPARRARPPRRRPGASRTRASGRSAASGATSCTRRRWRGSPSTARCGRSRSTGSRGRSTAGAGCATRSTRTSASAASTRSSAPSRSRTARSELDASLLLLPLVGFLPATDPRIRGTIEAVERELLQDGFVLRYRTHEDAASTGCRRARACSCRARSGSPTATSCSAGTTRRTELFERLVGLANDLGLLSEEYDPEAERLLGNFPQAFTHLALVNTAFNLAPHLPSPMHRAARAGTSVLESRRRR